MSDGIASIVAESALQLGYTSLKKEQEEAVKGFLDGRDVFVALATGFGKSLCDSLLPLVFDKTSWPQFTRPERFHRHCRVSSFRVDERPGG